MKKFLILLAAFVFTALWTAPSFALTPEFYGSYRVRAFAVENDTDFNDDGADTDSWIDQRFRLGVEAKASDQLRGFFQLEIGDRDVNRSNTWGTGNADGYVTGGTLSNLAISVRQAYLSFNIGDIRLKAGRQVFGDAPDGGHSFRVADDKVYYGLYDGGLVFVSVVDAFVATYKYDATTFYAMYGKLSERGTGARPTTTYSTTTETYTGEVASDGDDDIFALQAWYKQDTWDIGAYFVYERDYTTAGTEDEPMWLGLGLGAKFDPVSIKAHAVWQTGSVDIDGVTGMDYDAYALDLDVSAKFDALTIGAVIGMGSGDDSAVDDDIENYTAVRGATGSYGVQLGGRPAIFFDNGEVSNGGAALASSAATPGNPGAINGLDRTTLGNITFLELYGSYKFSDTLSMSGLIANFWLTEDEDAANDSLGSEVDLTITYKLYPQLSLHGQAAWFFPDDGFYTQGTEGEYMFDDVVSEYFARVQYDF